MKRITLILLLSCFWVAVSFMDGFCREKTMLDLYRLAEQNDPEFNAVKSETAASEELLPQSRGLFLPQVSLDGQYGGTDYENKLSPYDTDTFETLTYNFQLRQAVLNLSSVAQYRIAGLQAEAARLELKHAGEKLALRLVSAVISLKGAVDRLAFLEAELRDVSERLVQTESARDLGMLSGLDVTVLKAETDLIRADILEAREEIWADKAALSAITGPLPETWSPGRLDFSSLKVPEVAAVRQHVEKALRSNTGILKFIKREQIARQVYRQNLSAHYPTLEAVGAHLYSDIGGGPDEEEKTETSIMLEFKLPIFEGGMTTSRVRQAKKLTDAARFRRLAEHERVKAKTTGACRLMAVLSEKESALARSIRSTHGVIDANRRSYQLGRTTIHNVLASEKKLVALKQELNKTRYDFLSNWFTLQILTGRLVGDSLGRIRLQAPQDLDLQEDSPTLP